MNNNTSRWRQRQRQTYGALLSRERETHHLIKGVEFVVLVYRYDAVTPFVREVQEVPPHLRPEP